MKSNTAEHPARRAREAGREAFWDLRLYVAGLAGKYSIQVVDLLKNPQLARGGQILAIPTLVRRLPESVRKVIGDLSNTGRTLVGLDIRPGNL